MADGFVPKVAWIAGVGEGETARGREVGRSIALLLAANGVAIVVTGQAERPLGACVGEAAFGGGKARHVVGGIGTPEAARSSAEAACARFGPCDAVVVAAGTLRDAENAFDAAAPLMKPGGRLVAVIQAGVDVAELSAWVRERAIGAASRGLTCNVISLISLISLVSRVSLASRATTAPALRAAEPEDVAQAVAFLVGSGAPAVSGSVLALS